LHYAETGGGTRRLAVVAVVNFLGFLAELVGGLVFGSVALVSDAFHLIQDGGPTLKECRASGPRWKHKRVRW